MEQKQLQNILEAVLLSAESPLKVPQIEALFAGDNDMPTRDEIRQALHELQELYRDRGFELKQVASGFRIQVRQDYAAWVGRLWEEKPARYTRALLETMALIAYRQPITRGEIEEVRGVSVSSNIIKTLMERDWVRVLGHKDVPGKPALYGTTQEFLDYFNLKSLDELPTLAEIKDLDNIHPELALGEDITDAAAPEGGERTDAGAEEQAQAGTGVEADSAAEEQDQAVVSEVEDDMAEDGNADAAVAEAAGDDGDLDEAGLEPRVTHEA